MKLRYIVHFNNILSSSSWVCGTSTLNGTGCFRAPLGIVEYGVVMFDQKRFKCSRILSVRLLVIYKVSTQTVNKPRYLADGVNVEMLSNHLLNHQRQQICMSDGPDA
jgi:hypothetical protein